jgi:hypothetical protein
MGHKPNGRPGNKRKAAILPFARAENRGNYTSRMRLEAQKVRCAFVSVSALEANSGHLIFGAYVSFPEVQLFKIRV